MVVDEKINQNINDLEKRIYEKIITNNSKLREEIYLECNKESALEKYALLHFNAVKHIFDETRNSLETLIKYGLGIISIIAAILFYFVGQKYKDFDQIKQEYKVLTEDIKNKTYKIKSLTNDLEKELEKVNKLQEDLEKKDEEVYELLRIRKSIKNTKIVWAFESKHKYHETMLDELQNNGFNNILKWNIYSEESAPSTEQCDFMIYSYTNSDSEKSSERLDKLISFLDSTKRNVPFMIYTYNNGKKAKVPEQHMNMLNNYQNYSISTTPGNFKSLFNGLILGIYSLIA